MNDNDKSTIDKYRNKHIGCQSKTKAHAARAVAKPEDKQILPSPPLF